MRQAPTIPALLTAALLLAQSGAWAAPDAKRPADPKALAKLSARIGASYRKILENLEDQVLGRGFPRPFTVDEKERAKLEDLLPRYFTLRRELGLENPERLELSDADQNYLEEVRGRIRRLRYGSEDDGLVASVNGAAGDDASWQVQGSFSDGSETTSALTAQTDGPDGERASWCLEGVALMDQVVARASGNFQTVSNSMADEKPRPALPAADGRHNSD